MTALDVRNRDWPFSLARAIGDRGNIVVVVAACVVSTDPVAVKTLAVAIAIAIAIRLHLDSDGRGGR